MGFIARIKDCLFDRRNVIEIESLEGEAKVSSVEVEESLEVGEDAVIGENLLGKLPKGTTLYKHYLTFENGNYDLIFITNSDTPITSISPLVTTPLIMQIVIKASSIIYPIYGANLLLTSVRFYVKMPFSDAEYVDFSTLNNPFTDTVTQL